MRNFQIAKGLGADGIVGPLTWAALIQGKQLDQGDSGQPVRALQVLLREKFGFGAVNVDADFGPITDDAVREFQDVYGLDVDGIVGPDTWQALIAIELNVMKKEATKSAPLFIPAIVVFLTLSFRERQT